MSYAIEQYQNTFSQEWDRYIWEADNGNIFHTRRFLSYHPKTRFIDHSLIFRDKNAIKALFPAIELQLDKDKVLFSHRGSSYGGFVYKNAGIQDAYHLVISLKEYAKQNAFSKIILTLPPIFYMKKFSNYIDFALIQNEFRYQKREISSIVQLPYLPAISSKTVSDAAFALLKPEARTAVRKSIKQGVDVRLSDDYEAYYKILEKNLMLRHNVKPTHTLDELKKLITLFPDRIHLWGAYVKDKLIAGIINFLATDNVVLAFYISDDKTYQHYRSVNQLFYKIFMWSIENKFTFYDFGIFTVNMEPNWGLGKFKESFGARGLFRDTFELQL
jgi:hypothetical protein